MKGFKAVDLTEQGIHPGWIGKSLHPSDRLLLSPVYGDCYYSSLLVSFREQSAFLGTPERTDF